MNFIVRRRRNVDGHYTGLQFSHVGMELVNYNMYMAALINGLTYKHLQVLRTLGVLLIITCGLLYIQSEGGHIGSLQPVT